MMEEWDGDGQIGKQGYSLDIMRSLGGEGAMMAKRRRSSSWESYARSLFVEEVANWRCCGRLLRASSSPVRDVSSAARQIQPLWLSPGSPRGQRSECECVPR